MQKEEEEYNRGTRAPARALWEIVGIRKSPTELFYSCAIPMAETIIYNRDDQSWLYTDKKSGTLVLRPGSGKAGQISGKEFYRHFLKLSHERKRHVKGKPRDWDPDFGCLAVLRTGEGNNINTQILSEKEFRAYADSDFPGNTICVQQYISCKGGIGSSLRHEYEFKDNKTVKIDVFKCFDVKTVGNVQNRVNAETKEKQQQLSENPEGEFETPQIDISTLDKTRVTGQSIVLLLTRYVRDIVKVIESARRCKVMKIVTEWVVDDMGDYYFTHAPELYTESTKKVGVPQLRRITNPKHVTEELASKQRGKCNGDFCDYEIEENFDDEDGKRRRRKSKDNYDIQPTRNTELEPDLENMYTIPYRSVMLCREEKLTMDHWQRDQEARNFLAFLYGDDTPDFSQIAKNAITGEVPKGIPVAKYYSQVTVCENCYKIYTKLDRGREVAVEHKIASSDDARKRIVKIIAGGKRNNKNGAHEPDEKKPFLAMINRAREVKTRMDSPFDVEESHLDMVPKADESSVTFAHSLLGMKPPKGGTNKENDGARPASRAGARSAAGRRRAGSATPSKGAASPGPQRVQIPDMNSMEEFLGANWIDSDEQLNEFLKAIKINH